MSILVKGFYLLPLRLRLRIKGYRRLGYFMDLSDPRSFNEKINCFKLSGWGNKHALCADKVAVREYVGSKGLSTILSDAIVFSRPFEFSELDNALKEFGDLFLKANHNSGPVFRVKITDSLETKRAAYSAIRSQLKKSYGYYNGELWYDAIEPRALCERTLLDSQGRLPPDFKFHVFSGGHETIVILQYDYDRFFDHGRTLLTEKLNILPYSIQYKDKRRVPVRPPNFDEMIGMAKSLASPFDYARVDLYNINGIVRFGEITFAPDGGFARFSDRVIDYEWGRWLRWDT